MNHSGRIEQPQQILKHQTNNSTAKYHWSFSKSRRFSDNKGYTQTISYNLPSSVSKRKSGIGYGSRSKYFDGLNTTNPAPGLYELGTTFENKKERKGFSFGYNRDELRYAHYCKQQQVTPAAYPLNESLVKSTKAYSMRPKTAYPKNYFLPNQEQVGRIKQLPGPGKYQTIDLIGSGKNFYNSKNKTQNQKTFQGSQRFFTNKITPGPSDYRISNTIQADGHCILSTMKSSGRRPILNDKRELFLAGNKYTPGPGNYQKPSDFGHYQGPRYSSRPKTARN